MMGRAVASLDIPTAKGSAGVLFMTEKEAHRMQVRDCIRCVKCVNVCPMGLNPTELMNFTEYEVWDKAEKCAITDCIECGSCSYICPAYRPLLDYIRLGKGKVMTIIRGRNK
jgi:electron transport complex protein RnfC